LKICRLWKTKRRGKGGRERQRKRETDREGEVKGGERRKRRKKKRKDRKGEKGTTTSLIPPRISHFCSEGEKKNMSENA
jgi:hypothetical protein